MSNAGKNSDLGDDVNMDAGSDLADELKNKLHCVAKEQTDVLESLSPNVRRRVEVLREIQNRHDEMEAKFLEERAALEAKYQKLYQPLHAKRYNIVNGVSQAEGTTNDMDTDQKQHTAAQEKGVPGFWLIAMKNNDVLCEEITELDEAALMYLKDIKWHKMEVPKGFKLEFYFDTNPYFQNSVLTKTYLMIDEDDPVLEKTIGTEIEWYPGKCLTPNKGSKTKDFKSFFNFFYPPHIPDDDDDDDDDEDLGEYTAEELQILMEDDYEIGSTIRDKLIPHAVSWFTGEATPGYEPDTDDDDDDDDDYLYVEDDEDEVDDEEEEDEEEKMRIRKKSVRARGDVQQSR
ncbi:hypothetical protein GQ457_10G001100 [Hibiscus cannabinus]